MKCSLDISNFLEEISSLTHSMLSSISLQYSFKKGLFTPPCYFLELCIQLGNIFPFLTCLLLLFFPQLFVRPPQTTILPFLHFFFLEMVLITPSCKISQTSIHSSSGILSIRSSPLNLFLTSTVYS